jgi:hypothetical protein
MNSDYSAITPIGWSEESQTYSLNTLYTVITIIVLTSLITYTKHTNDYKNKKSPYEKCLEKINYQTNILERIEISIKEINVKEINVKELNVKTPTEVPTEAEEEIDFSLEEIEKLTSIVNSMHEWGLGSLEGEKGWIGARIRNATTNLCQANTLAMLSWYNNDKPNELLLCNEEHIPIEVIEFHLRQYDDIFTSVTKKNTEKGLYYTCDKCFKYNNIRNEIVKNEPKRELQNITLNTQINVMHRFTVKQMMKVFDSSSEIRCFKKYKRTQEDIQYQCGTCYRFIKKTKESVELIKLQDPGGSHSSRCGWS